jgi:hypothetical protein
VDFVFGEDDQGSDCATRLAGWLEFANQSGDSAIAGKNLHFFTGLQTGNQFG